MASSPARPRRAAIVGHRQFTFNEFKGRILLVASDFPFRNIVGVEFAPPLAEIAKQNLVSYRNRTQKYTTIEVLAMDATQYKLPEESLVLYFYTPFPPPALEQVFLNIEHRWNSRRAIGSLSSPACRARTTGLSASGGRSMNACGTTRI